MARRRGAPDLQLRELERRARETGTTADVMAYHQQLVRVGQDASYYGQLLLADFLEDVEVRGFRVGVRAPNFDDGTGGSILVPDPFGRPQGIILSAVVTNEQRTWGLSIQDMARKAKETGQEPEPDNSIRIQAALAHKMPGAEIHPFYFWVGNQWSLDRATIFEGRTPVRYDRHALLVREYLADPQSLARQAAAAYTDLVGWLMKSHVTHELEELRRRFGGRITFEDVTGFVSGLGPSMANAAVAALQAVRPPPRPGVGIGPGAIPLNASGAGWAHWAILALARYLERERALVEPYTIRGPFPRDMIGGSTSISFTTRRARRTRNPAIVKVEFDPVMGLWAKYGDRWKWNSIPSGGRWEIDSRASPGTVQDMAEDAQWWIVKRFPDAEIWAVEDWAEGGRVRIYPQ